MDGDWSWLSNLFSSGQGSTSALGGLGSSGNMGQFTMPGATDAASASGVGSNPYGFSMSQPNGASNPNTIDPKALQSVLSAINGPQKQNAPSAGVAPRGGNVQLQTKNLNSTLRGPLGKMVYGS